MEYACHVWLIAEYVQVLLKLSAFLVGLASICLYKIFVLPVKATAKPAMPRSVSGVIQDSISARNNVCQCVLHPVLLVQVLTLHLVLVACWDIATFKLLTAVLLLLTVLMEYAQLVLSVTLSPTAPA
jgi:hypothetical protein